MSYDVFLTEDAERDLEDIFDYIAVNDSEQAAFYVLEKLEALVMSLKDSPTRGGSPKELGSLGMRDYRELYFKPYRVVYRVSEKSVYVYLVVDGRRDLQTLLLRRLLQ